MEQPPIRILRRPCPVSTENSDSPNRPTVIGKTFEQREADYAAARERIFGQLNLESRPSSPHDVEPKLPSPASLPSLSVNASTTVASSSIPELPISTLCLGFQNSTPLLGTPTNRQTMAVVNVGRKLQQQQHSQSGSNGSRTNVQPQQQRVLTNSASSPSFFNQPGRNTQPMPLLSSQVGNCQAGLLPTPPPPGFNFSIQPTATSNNGLQNSQATAMTLMHHFNLLQYYQQTLNGIQNQLVPSSTSLSSHPLNFAPVISQPNANPKYTHPHTFN